MKDSKQEGNDMIPCEECLVRPTCSQKRHIYCNILYEWIFEYYDKAHPRIQKSLEFYREKNSFIIRSLKVQNESRNIYIELIGRKRNTNENPM
jgi:hypothetical protein